MTALASIGHNKASPRELAADVMRSLGEWLADTPVIIDESMAGQAARWAKRAANCLADIEAERSAKRQPHTDAIAAINLEFKAATAPLQTVLTELHQRMTAWAVAEENRKREEAERARQEAIAAEERAIAARQVQVDALDNAAKGEIGVDVVEHALAAQEATQEAAKAERVWQRAQRDTKVRMASGMGRAYALRSQTTLEVTDPAAAVAAFQAADLISEKLRERIATDAGAFQKLKGALPPGVTSTTTRKV